MEFLLGDDPRWVIDEEPIESAGVVPAVPEVTESFDISGLIEPILSEPVETPAGLSVTPDVTPLDPAIAHLVEPLPEEDREFDPDAPLIAEPLPPEEMIDQYRDYDFRKMIDPEGDNWYGRDDESIGDLTRKWMGNTPLGGVKGIFQFLVHPRYDDDPDWWEKHPELAKLRDTHVLLAERAGLPDISDVKQLTDALARFQYAPGYILESEEGQGYNQYLQDRLNEAIMIRDTPFLEMINAFIEGVYNDPVGTGGQLARAIVDDPIMALSAIGVYNVSKKAGLAGANLKRIKQLSTKLKQQGTTGVAAANILTNGIRIAPTVLAEGVYAGEYERMNNLMRGSPIENDVTNMQILGGLLGATARGIGVGIESRRAPYLGADVRPEKGATTISEEMAELGRIIGRDVRKGATDPDVSVTRGRGRTDVERTENIGVSGRQRDINEIESAVEFEQRQLLRDRVAVQRSQIREHLKQPLTTVDNTVPALKEIVDSKLGSVYKLRKMPMGWVIKTGFTDRSKGSGLINYDRVNKIITIDTPRLKSNPTEAFEMYVAPKVAGAFGRTYSAAAKSIGFDTQKLQSLLRTPEEMLHFALAKEKHYIGTQALIPKKTNATKAYRDARNMYRHEVSLHKALDDIGYDTKILKEPSKWNVNKVAIADKVAAIINNKTQTLNRAKEAVITPAVKKGRDVYDETIEAKTIRPIGKGEPITVDTEGVVVPPRIPVKPKHIVEAGVKGVKTGYKEFKGRFDDTPRQLELDLDPPVWRNQANAVYKGKRINQFTKILQMMNNNKRGALSLLLGRTPTVAVLADSRGRAHIDKWEGDNAILDRHAHALQTMVMKRLPNEERRRAAAHYIEGTLDEYNLLRQEKNLDEIVFTREEIGFIDNALRPMLSEIFLWATKHKLIGRDVETGNLRYRHNYFPHITKRSFTRSFEDYINELTDKGKSAVSMKPTAAYARQFKTLLEAEATGYAMHTDIAKVLGTYIRGIWRVQSNKALTNALKTTKVGDDTLVMSQDSAPINYVELRHPAFMDVDGSYMKVHPGLKRDLKMYFDTSDPTILRRLAVNINTTMKRIKIGLSLFHAQALLESALYAGLNPLKTKRLYQTTMNRLLQGPMGDEIDMYLRAGLKIGGIDDVNSDALLHLMGATSASLDRMTGPKSIGRVAKLFPDAIAAITKKVDSLTWDHVMTIGKIISMDKAYGKLVRADIKRALKNGEPLRSEAALAQDAATYVNDAFGGLDWKQLARNVENKVGKDVGSYLASKHGRETLQLTFFAPDWSTANIRILFKGLPGASSNRAMGNLYRAYFVRGALMYLIGAEGLQQANTGTSIFDNYGSRGWLRPHIGDGVHIELSKQLTEVFRTGTYLSQGRLDPIHHKGSSLYHVMANTLNGKPASDIAKEALVPISIQAISREGVWGIPGVFGKPAYVYQKPWEIKKSE